MLSRSRPNCAGASTLDFAASQPDSAKVSEGQTKRQAPLCQRRRDPVPARPRRPGSGQPLVPHRARSWDDGRATMRRRRAAFDPVPASPIVVPGSGGTWAMATVTPAHLAEAVHKEVGLPRREAAAHVDTCCSSRSRTTNTFSGSPREPRLKITEIARTASDARDQHPGLIAAMMKGLI